MGEWSGKLLRFEESKNEKEKECGRWKLGFSLIYDIPRKPFHLDTGGCDGYERR